MIRVGAQLSQASGYEQVIQEAGAAGLRSLQLFSRNPVGGQSRTLPSPGSLRAPLRAAGIEVLFIHAPYFVNPAATDEAMLNRARIALKQEMRRAKRLSADYVVLHPGHWQEKGRRQESLDAFCGTVVAMLEAPGRVLIENAAGQGRELGFDFEELGEIFCGIGRTSRIGLILDTAHAMAAGHALTTSDDVSALLEIVDKHIGLERVRGIHLNDSLYPVGSHHDRHAHLLTGSLGIEALRRIVAWAKETTCPLILETPGRDIAQRQRDLKTIWDLI